MVSLQELGDGKAPAHLWHFAAITLELFVVTDGEGFPGGVAPEVTALFLAPLVPFNKPAAII